MTKKLLPLLLIIVMILTMAVPAFAAPASNTATEADLETMVRGYVEDNYDNDSIVGSIEDYIASLVTDAVMGMLGSTDALLGLASPLLSSTINGLINTALAGANIPVGDIDVSEILDGVLNSDIINNILSLQIVTDILARTTEYSVKDALEIAFGIGGEATVESIEELTQKYTDEIFGMSFVPVAVTNSFLANPIRLGSFLLFSNKRGDTVNPFYVIEAVSVDYNVTGWQNEINAPVSDIPLIGQFLGTYTTMEAYIAARVAFDVALDAGGTVINFDMTAFSAELPGIIWAAALRAAEDVVNERIDALKVQIEALIRAEIQKAKDRLVEKAKAEAKKAVVAGLNDIFNMELTTAMSYDEMISAVESKIDEHIIANADLILIKLNIAKKVAIIADCDEAVDCIEKLIACVESKIPPCVKNGHTKEDLSLAATCTEAGYTKIVCAICGDVLEEEVIDALGHDEEDQSLAATCTEAGYTKIVCAICGEDLEYEDLEALGHIEDDQSVAATCEEAGYTKIVCLTCGEVLAEEVIAALGHEYDDGVITTLGRCFYGNTWTYTCAICGDSYDEVAEPFGAHNLEQYEYYQDWQTGKWGWKWVCVNPGCDHHEWIADADPDVVVNITFTGVEGVTVQYYSPSVNWVTVGVYDDEASFVIPEDALTYNGYYAVKALKGGMTYQVSNITLVDGESIDIEVPVKPITVTGVSSECTLAIVQNNWVYNSASAAVGVPNVFNVFDNGGTYEVRVGRTGYSNIQLPGYFAGDNVWLDVFYNITIPEGVSNIRIANANWVDTTVWYANYLQSDVITLMKNNGAAKLYFDYAGKSYTVDFVLDGSNPFDQFKYTVNFPGMEGVTLHYYKNGVWNMNAGVFDNTATLFMPDPGITTIRVAKGSSYRFDGITGGGVFDVPIGTITIEGIGFDCKLSIVGSDWVYQNIACDAGEKTFNVFATGVYELRIAKDGFSTISLKGLTFDATLDISEYFYSTIVPEGVSNVRIQSNGNWIDNSGSKPLGAGTTINLLKTNGAGKMYLTYKGKTSNVDFVLDGSDPFNVVVESGEVVAPTCSLEGYTITYINLATGEKWYSDYTSALGHTHDDPTWDDYGWYITCGVCGWAGYISYDPDAYAA